MNYMKCEKNELGECNKDCDYFLYKQKEPERFMCLTLPHGLYGDDTVLVEAKEWKRLMKT